MPQVGKVMERKIPLWLILAGGLAYSNSFSVPFIFDDRRGIVDNPHIRQCWPLHAAFRTPSRGAVAGRPLVNFSLALNFAVSGLEVWSYHLLNLVVHLGNSLLLYGILGRTLRRILMGGDESTARVLAFAATLLWMVHPLLTESVTYVVQRTELLMGFFMLLTLFCVCRGAESSRPHAWYVGAVTACFWGMGCKETMVVTPILVLAYDSLFLSPSWRVALRRRWGLYAGLAASWAPLAFLVAHGYHHEVAGFHFPEMTPWDYAKTQCGVLLYYLRLSLWPHPLVLDYSDWPIARAAADFAVPGLVVLALLVATGFGWSYRVGASFLGVWFF